MQLAILASLLFALVTPSLAIRLPVEQRVIVKAGPISSDGLTIAIPGVLDSPTNTQTFNRVGDSWVSRSHPTAPHNPMHHFTVSYVNDQRVRQTSNCHFTGNFEGFTTEVTFYFSNGNVFLHPCHNHGGITVVCEDNRSDCNNGAYPVVPPVISI